jgi:hypothetical protein
MIFSLTRRRFEKVGLAQRASYFDLLPRGIESHPSSEDEVSESNRVMVVTLGAGPMSSMYD